MNTTNSNSIYNKGADAYHVFLKTKKIKFLFLFEFNKNSFGIYLQEKKKTKNY